MSTIALIPARSGSRGIPQKNIRPLGGKPLIHWTLATAMRVKGLDRIVVSAGDEDILNAALEVGAEAFVRPKEINDTGVMIRTVMDAIEHLHLEGDDDNDAIILLQPTAPFRSVESVERCLGALEDGDSAMTVIRVPDRFHPNQVIDGNHKKYPVHRQHLDPRYVRAGSVYAFWVGTFTWYGNIYGETSVKIEVPEHEALNLDEMADWHEAERRIKEAGLAQEAAASPMLRKEQAQQAAL